MSWLFKMPIIITLELILKDKKMKSKELAELIDITEANLSILNNGKGKAIRFSTLDAICRVLKCQPGDIIKYIDEDN
ncbi:MULTISPECIES: helix-turn-helix domain-containing protein [Morganellaceae]|uniref:helix-turn-helix domain-containing protein n=1 Tax=Morganellaceae TaxID=1903414 RepID=UPI003CD0C5FA